MEPVNVNPIIPGFAPDPSIILVNEIFYLVTSSFHLYPGLPLYSSSDLCNWRHIGNAINRPEQLSLAKSGTNLISENRARTIPATGGLYAPTIRQFDGTVYIVCTNVVHDSAIKSGIRFENFIISTQDILSGSWTDPVYFDFHGIDPSLYFDSNGRAYIQGSAWGTKTTINCFEIDVKTVAEGGTHEGHQITFARPKAIYGPFESCDKNPILKPGPSNNAIQYTGHGDIFQDQNSDWWMVCLGVRKKGDRCLFGRETFLSRVTWNEDNWPCPSPPVMDFPICLGNQSNSVQIQPNKVSPSSPAVDLVWIRCPGDVPTASMDSQDELGSTISVKPLRADISENTGPVAFVGERARRYGTAKVDIKIDELPTQCSLKAGIAFYKDEHRFTRIYWDSQSSAIVFEVLNRAQSLHKTATTHSWPGKSVRLSIIYGADQIKLTYGLAGDSSCHALGILDVADLTDPDFVGPVVGVFATSSADISSDVMFHGFSVERSRKTSNLQTSQADLQIIY